MISGTKTQADIDANKATAAHDHQDQLAARARARTGPVASLGSRLASAVQRLLGRPSR
jgi:hypothetical protein